MPATRRCVFACEMTASPSLQEPIFLVDITAPTDAQGGIYNCMNQRRGIIFQEEQRAGTNLMQMRAHLPVAESFGFTGALRQATSGQAFPQCSFSHWETMQGGDPMSAGSKLNELCLAIRSARGRRRRSRRSASTSTSSKRIVGEKECNTARTNATAWA